MAARVLHLETSDSTCLRRESQIRIILINDIPRSTNIITTGLDAMRLNVLHSLEGIMI